ncbi:cAMP-binding domain of CRP or a regulatory subunit of cAMP-dependent protein kinases [Peptostreptococcus russellii]|uniref:cAMP-binding domain of CRP or a regulatory subunit of cAMP-dependent protein kinases n=1 Tax=Peptostreptococcus russellii TaxID=215200 RepID=A0A1H8F9G8_9FIRM|nr:Crp/Fnr family transcriptional regulator [Peptostreptococcus russellii]SEN28195.1 cAMP-binding domain of CRP or a regulatory subunit of cAMP-dependent protein kinases [Peptostreptococcus russellii]
MNDLFWDRMIFEGISEESKKAIENMPKEEKSYKANELVSSEGEAIESVCIILTGALKATEYTSEGKELNSSYYFAGDAFPFYLVYGGIKKNFSNTYALKKSRVVWLKVKDLIPIIDNDQVFLHNILRFVAEYCCYSKLIIRCTQYRRVLDRLSFWLLHVKNPDKLIEIPNSQEVLADILHVNRSSLNQELKFLDTEGIIELEKKKIRVIDKEYLQSLL